MFHQHSFTLVAKPPNAIAALKTRVAAPVCLAPGRAASFKRASCERVSSGLMSLSRKPFPLVTRHGLASLRATLTTLGRSVSGSRVGRYRRGVQPRRLLYFPAAAVRVASAQVEVLPAAARDSMTISRRHGGAWWRKAGLRGPPDGLGRSTRLPQRCARRTA
jgi:hypothetical protein